ncbi:MAG: hypothetical protein H6Q04_111 [Acidobacteria bacterium]|nr:hypothetical protein [Acidobacteriota bacterium]
MLECPREARERGLLRGKDAPEKGIISAPGIIFALAHSITGVPNAGAVAGTAGRVRSVIEFTIRERPGVEAKVRGSSRISKQPKPDCNLKRRMK